MFRRLSPDEILGTTDDENVLSRNGSFETLVKPDITSPNETISGSHKPSIRDMESSIKNRNYFFKYYSKRDAMTTSSTVDTLDTTRNEFLKVTPKPEPTDALIGSIHDTLEPRDLQSLDVFTHRAGWLVVLLLIQSLSSFVLVFFHDLVHAHPVIVYFLTMLIGAGGNAGSQSTVLAIRGLALGNLNPSTRLSFVLKQLKEGFYLACLLGIVSVLRVYISGHNLKEITAVTASMVSVVFISTFVGSILPLTFQRLRIDPAHAGAAIQVSMDIIGVSVTCCICYLVLEVE